MGVQEKIREIEEEMRRTQKNKATNFHLGLLKGKLARLRTQLIEGTSSGKSSGGPGFEVLKSGDARVALVGFPSVGKSTLLSKLTATESRAAAFAFTTLTCIPGVLKYNDAKIQILDLPGIIENAAAGIGRGRQVIAVARTSDLILMVVDANDGFKQIKLLTKELETAGIRLNQSSPDVSIRKKKTGGVMISSAVPLTNLNLELAKAVLADYKIHNAHVLIKDDINIDQFIDCIEGNRAYIRCIYAFNKIDNIKMGAVEQIARRKDSIPISSNETLNLNRLTIFIWEYLNLVRIYTKPKGKAPDLSVPIILRKGSTVKDFCESIHRGLIDSFRYAMVWGTSARHRPQSVGLAHILEEEDVVQIVA